MKETAILTPEVTFTTQGTSSTFDSNFYMHTVDTYYPTMYTYWNTYPNKIETAFKLTQKLLEKKIIKEPKTIGEFIELVNTIAETI